MSKNYLVLYSHTRKDRVREREREREREKKKKEEKKQELTEMTFDNLNVVGYVLICSLSAVKENQSVIDIALSRTETEDANC